MIRKAINKLFKRLGYLPANDVIFPKCTIIEHTRVDYVLVAYRTKVRNEDLADTKRRDCILNEVKFNLAKELVKQLNVEIVDSENPFEVELRCKIFVAK